MARRWPLYLLTCAAVFGLQLAFASFARIAHPEVYAAIVGQPFVIAVVTVFAGADATGKLSTAQCWERIAERAWAIIVMDVGFSVLNASALKSVESADGVDVVFGFLAILLGGMLVYAEPFAALEKDAQTLTLIPFALLRSMMLAWVNISRVFALLAVQIATAILLLLAEEGARRAGIAASVWVDLGLATLVSAPLAALYAVAYLDTLSVEKRT